MLSCHAKARIVRLYQLIDGGYFRLTRVRDPVGAWADSPKKKVATMMDRRKETSVVKKALKNAGIKARVTHGTGTAWGWIEVNIGNPEERGGLEPYPNGYGRRYTDEESNLHNKTLRIVQEVTGRHGEYNGNISILSQDVV